MSRISFRVSTGPNTSWSCPMACDRCTYIKPNGHQCGNKVCFGSPFCWIHNIRAYGVRAKPSTIAGAGKGLFATRTFQANEWICPMICEHISEDCLEQRYPGDMTAPYAEADEEDDTIIDCACSRGIASQANALFRADGMVRHIRFHNAIAVHRNEVGYHVGVWVRARRIIPAGNEIFLWYGVDYRLENNHTTKRRKKMPSSAPC